MIAEVDSNSSGAIDLQEFLGLMAMLVQPR
jgi:hypothetical protein